MILYWSLVLFVHSPDQHKNIFVYHPRNIQTNFISCGYNEVISGKNNVLNIFSYIL